MLEHGFTGRCQRRSPRAAGTLHERRPDHPLERDDLVADRRLHVAEPLRRAAERAFARNRLERLQMPDLEPDPARIGAAHDGFDACTAARLSGNRDPS
jgi:hypothetical protein